MSSKHPIISVVGASGAGTSTVRHTFEQIFRRENVVAATIEGDAFHAYDRPSMKAETMRRQSSGDNTFSHFSLEANLLSELEAQFAAYGQCGRCRTRTYVHSDEEGAEHGVQRGHFTPWREIGDGSDLLFYEGLHGAVQTGDIDIARHADLKIGVVPVINLEWIQKIHRDRDTRGYTTDAVRSTILRRMHAYVHVICPQFTQTDINFQRVPIVDTSNPFVARWIPTAGESLVVIRFRNPRGVDFPYFVTMIPGSWMTRANSIVIPGDKLDLAMQLILTPMIMRLAEQARSQR